MKNSPSDNGACRTWRFGKLTITQVVEVESTFSHRFILSDADDDALADMPWLSPHYVDSDGKLRLSIQAFIIDDTENRIIVDTCLGNNKERAMDVWSNLSGPFLENLKKAGYERHTITHVICTHLHIDHVGWNTMWNGESWVPTFPNSEYIFTNVDWEHWSKSEHSDDIRTMEDSVLPLFQQANTRLVSMSEEILPHIKLIPTPGHTPGHVSVCVESDGKQALISGDIMHHPCQIAHPEWGSHADHSPELAEETRRCVMEQLENTKTALLGTHFSRLACGFVVGSNADRSLVPISPERHSVFDTTDPKSQS